MPAMADAAAQYRAMKESLWPGPSVLPEVARVQDAIPLRMYADGTRPRAGSLSSDHLDIDSHWHFHDMHQLIYAFEGAIEVEVAAGRHLIPRQLAAWIPAGVPHRASLHKVRSGNVFLTREMIAVPGEAIRVLLVSPLMREMMREAMRWPLHGHQSPLRTSYFQTMALLCQEWMNHEADLFLPVGNDPRLRRALDFTTVHSESKLADVCGHAGMSERSLRRHLKAETGLTWEAYRHRSRLLRAITLLSETSMPIAEIAASCGFESASAFAKAFRSTIGQAPRTYRTNIIAGRSSGQGA